MSLRFCRHPGRARVAPGEARAAAGSGFGGRRRTGDFRAQWLTEWYGYDPNVAKALGLGEHERMAGFVHIGRLVAPPKERVRPALADALPFWQP